MLNFLRIPIKLSLILSFLFLCLGCTSEYTKIRKELIEFERSEIVLPSDMLIISNGQVLSGQEPLETASTFFAYFPSVDCSDCIVSKINALVPIFSLMKENGLLFKCIISPTDGLVDELVSKISKINAPYDFYIDVSDSFSLLNKSLPPDPRFNLFCTDLSGIPFFVGNPCSDETTYQLFLRSFKKIKK